MTKIVICDDHQLFRDGLAKLVQTIKTCEVVATTDQGSTLLKMLANGLAPDIILVDIHMPPGLNGYEVVRFCKQHYPDIKFIAISFFDDPKAIKNMMNAGAKAFISKSCSGEDLQRAIFAVAENNYFLNLEADAGVETSNVATLTSRELETARLMCTDKPYKQIARDLKISPNTIENIRIRLFKKIGAKTRTELAIILQKTGLLQ
jgi:two-component system invasion response regulator UvrY